PRSGRRGHDGRDRRQVRRLHHPGLRAHRGGDRLSGRRLAVARATLASPRGGRGEAMSRWLAALPLIALLALGALFGFYALHRNPQVQPQALVGKPAPALSLPTLKEGTPTSVPQAAAAGPIIVNFFASWCAPCEIEN